MVPQILRPPHLLHGQLRLLLDLHGESEVSLAKEYNVQLCIIPRMVKHSNNNIVFQMFPGLEFHRCGIEKCTVINYMWHRVSTSLHHCRIPPAVKLGSLSARRLGYHIISPDKSGMGEIDSTGLLSRKILYRTPCSPHRTVQ